MERRQLRQADEEVPIFEEGQVDIQRPGRESELPIHEQGVKRDVVVDQQSLGVEVPTVGQTSLHSLPAEFGGFVDPHRRIAVADR